MKIKTLLTGLFLATTMVFLAGCDSADERAEKHFQSAIELLEAGDADRAIVEFKNVFKLKPQHRQARSRIAALYRGRGDIRQAVSQYLRLVEQYPDDFEGQRAIAEIYAETGNWNEMDRFVEAAANLQPDDQRTIALQLVLKYRRSIEQSNPDQAKSTIAEINKLVLTLPTSQMLRLVIIDDLVRQSDFAAARIELDRSIELQPDNKNLYVMRLAMLVELGDFLAVEKQLKDMIVVFPDDASVRPALIEWYVSQSQIDEAENFLRLTVQQNVGVIEHSLALVQFVASSRGPEAALEELNSMVAAGDPGILIRGLKAGYEFDLGNQEQAIAQLRDLLSGQETSEDVIKLKITLSQMLVSTGQTEEAQGVLLDILEVDPTNVAALDRRAGWLTDRDQVNDAIALLRKALEQDPRNPAIFTSLARAHERNGDRELIGEMLSLAMDASSGAPVESIRYAKYLISLGKNDVAEGVLIAALRNAPGNLAILTELGNAYVAVSDWPRANQIQQTLNRLGAPATIAAANDLKARILLGQSKSGEAVEFLKDLVDQGDAGFSANVAIVQNYLSERDFSSAQNHVAALLLADPGNPENRFLAASVDVATGELDAAEIKFLSLLKEDDQRSQVWVALYRIYVTFGKADKATDLINRARIALPNDSTLMWVHAGALETAGDIPAAIAIYEQLYEADSDNLIVANNLASLLSTGSDDPASLERAIAISNRLRHSDVPAFQDTYGWISYLGGNIDESVSVLEKAAAGMVNEPMVQFHLAQAYLAAGDATNALVQFQKVIALTGPDDTRDFIQSSRKSVEELSNATPEDASE
ncbi:MAG: tetratricopeptide repeat protein [Paracoccaceae bacterium]